MIFISAPLRSVTKIISLLSNVKKKKTITSMKICQSFKSVGDDNGNWNEDNEN